MRTLLVFASLVALAGLATAAAPAPTDDVLVASRPTHARRADRRDSVAVHVTVDRFGLVTAARPRAAAPSALDSAAVDAARWSVFAPGPAERLVSVPVAPPSDETLPAIDDVVPQALRAERLGQWSAAEDLWVGALGRVGMHPAYANPWPLYERAILAARRLPKVPPLPLKYLRAMVRVDGNAERAVSTQANTDLLAEVTPVTVAAPWFPRAWRVRACAAAGAGLPAEAARALRMWKLAEPDSATIARADSALAQIAAGELVLVNNALRR